MPPTRRKGRKKSAHAAAYGSTGLAHRLPNLMRRAGCRLACTVLLRGANWNSLMHLWSARGLRGRRQELPDNVPGDAHSDAQGAANHARSHPVYDGSSGLWRCSDRSPGCSAKGFGSKVKRFYAATRMLSGVGRRSWR